jgi:hypothetical protein
MSFIPKNYTEPSTSDNYFKIQEGDNRIRILSQATIGWEDWVNNKPVRFEFDKKPTKPSDPLKPIKLFWAFIVYNYGLQKIQIMQVTQATVRKSIMALCNDEDWGNPYSYDIKINKTGEGKETKYVVNPVPHKPVDPIIIKAFKDKPCLLDALFIGADPFNSEWKNYTQLGVEGNLDTERAEATPTSEQISLLKKLYEECDEKYQQKLLESLSKTDKAIFKIDDVPLKIYDKVLAAVEKNRNEYQYSLKKSA